MSQLESLIESIKNNTFDINQFEKQYNPIVSAENIEHGQYEVLSFTKLISKKTNKPYTIVDLKNIKNPNVKYTTFPPREINRPTTIDLEKYA